MKKPFLHVTSLLLLCASISYTAPPKASTLALRLEREMRRVSIAYQEVGDFSISSIETFRVGGRTVQYYCSARFAEDGKMSFKAIEKRKG